MPIFSRAPRPLPNDVLYFCRADGPWQPPRRDKNGSDSCLQPRPLSLMKYGCTQDDVDACSDSDKLPQGIEATSAIFESRVHCPKHQLPIRPRCPCCGEMIRKDDNGRPIRLVAGPHAGKTVYSAVLAHALQGSGFSRRFGFPVSTVHGRDYLRKTVRPLFEGEGGILPVKTAPGQSHKVVFKFLSEGARSELITLHDMAGEDAPGSPLGYFSDKTLFFINPQATSTSTGVHPLAGLVPGFVFDAVCTQVEILHRWGWLDHADESAVQVLCNLAAKVLRDQGFPHCTKCEDVASKLLGTARNVLGRATFTENEVKSLVYELKQIAEGLKSQPSFEDQFDDWYENMNKIGAPLDGERLVGHRLALVFSKTDLLRGEQHLWGRFDPKQMPTSRMEWLKGLEDLSKKCRNALMGLLKLPDLVEKVEHRVEHVGFFFVSSLGRDTEIKVEKIVVAQTNQAPQGQAHMMTQAPAQPSGQGQPRVEWQLTQLVEKGEDGTRCPSPQEVIYPLLWLLLST